MGRVAESLIENTEKKVKEKDLEGKKMAGMQKNHMLQPKGGKLAKIGARPKMNKFQT